MKTSAIFLVFLNFITAILSLVVIGGGAYILSTFSEWTELFGSNSVWIAIGGGVVAFIVSFLGCYGTLKEKTCFLMIYGLVIAAVLAATGAGIYFYNDAVAGLDSATSDDIVTDSAHIDFNDRLLSTYTYCCAGGSAPLYDPVIPAGECLPADGCIEVNYCSNSTNTGDCYGRPDGDLPTVPVNEISTSVCTALSNLDVDDAPIVGPLAENAASCGGGSPRAFTRAVYEWVDSNTSLIYGGSIGFAVLMAITLIATMYVTCCGSDSD